MKEPVQRNRELSRRSFVTSVAGLGLAASLPGSPSDQAKLDYPVKAVPLKDVEITDAFWTPRIDKIRTVTLPDLLGRTVSRGRGADGRLIEAASNFLAKRPDPALKNSLDSVLDRAIEGMRSRMHTWANVGDGPFSGAGTFFEGAIAYHQATGSRKLLDAAIEVADDIDSVFGPNKRYDISNHEGIEIGLAKLYRATDNDRYLKLAQFITDVRGTRQGGREMYGSYAQDHAPVRDQTRAIGHCVRATYLYNAVTELAALTGDPGYARAALRIWEDAVTKRTYLTGGVGSYRHEEDYGDDYDLPNLGCWNEICAAVGNTLWHHRMFLFHQDARYADMMERVLYNGLLAGVSLNGDKFLYQTPLKAFPAFERQVSFGPNCCPPNITRLMAEFGNFIYAHTDQNLYVNLFVGSQAKLQLSGTRLAIAQETKYPWDGATRITLNPENKAKFAVLVRIPGWARNEPVPGALYRYASTEKPAFSLTVNGKTVRYTLDRGYARIDREWAKGDTVELSLPMLVKRTRAHEQVADNRGMVALERGPLVFCTEGFDNNAGVFNLAVPDDAKFQYAYQQDLLGGMGTISGTVVGVSRGQDKVSVQKQPRELVAIPYFAFGNRGGTDMAVWLARDESKAVLAPRPTVASTSRATSSCGNGTIADNYPDHKPPTIAQRLYTNAQDGSGDIRAICDQLEPVNSEDESAPYLRLRPQSGDQAWVQYDFEKPAQVSSVSVYWKDDKQYCVIPKSWRLLYQDGGEWKPVRTSATFGVEKDKYNKVVFDPVTTSALRIEIQLQAKVYKKGRLGPPDANYLRDDLTWYEGGVIEWRVNA